MKSYLAHLKFKGSSFLLVSVGHFCSWTTDTADWSLGALHATTMGFVESLTMAMITRVSYGHSGRPLQADGLMWALFLLLQAVVVLRISADITQSIGSLWLLTAASTGWTLIFMVWGFRLLTWYGKPRQDNQPG
ncbi:MAG TPA: NnrS family protein [Orrella sp.]